ncbi:MAG: ferrous iron transport protein A [Lentihominibacter sp.]
MMPLSFADTDSLQVVKKIGGSPEVKRHLENLGFNVGEEIKIISTLGGNVIVRVKDSRIAISDEMARRIMV